MIVKILLLISKVLPIRKLGRNGDYLHRFFILRLPWFGIFLHRFLTSDSALELHSHPFSGFSIILWGIYREERFINGKVTSKIFRVLDVNKLNKDTFHRVDLLTKEVWTLFIRFKKPKKEDYKWGFIDRNTLEYKPAKEVVGDDSLLEDID